jgi:hypothetical protein
MSKSESVNLTYPNAVYCSIALKGAPVNGESGRSKYEISRACTEAASLPIPTIYDFSLGER